MDASSTRLIDNGDGTDATLVSPVAMNSPRALKGSLWIKHGGVVKVLYFNTLQDKFSGGLMNMVPVIHLDPWLVGLPGWIQLQYSQVVALKTSQGQAPGTQPRVRVHSQGL